MPHIHELYDFTVAPFIVYEDKVLLVNHPKYGKWIPPGGHIELDEDPEQALHREIAEETGLTVTLLTTQPALQSPGTKFMPTPNYMDVHEANLPHKHVGLVYFCRASSSDFVLSDEHTDMRWVSEDELDSAELNLSPAVKFYAREALATDKTL